LLPLVELFLMLVLEMFMVPEASLKTPPPIRAEQFLIKQLLMVTVPEVV